MQKIKFKASLVKNESGAILFDTYGVKPQIETNKDYTIEIKPYKSSRTLEQNRLMWALIQTIAEETGNDPMDVYISGLEHANAKYDFLLVLPETLNALKQAFRAVKVMSATRTVGDKEMIVCKCYIGSSKFDTKEMTTLIDFFIQEAEALGFDTNLI